MPQDRPVLPTARPRTAPRRLSLSSPRNLLALGAVVASAALAIATFCPIEAPVTAATASEAPPQPPLEQLSALVAGRSAAVEAAAPQAHESSPPADDPSRPGWDVIAAANYSELAPAQAARVIPTVATVPATPAAQATPVARATPAAQVTPAVQAPPAAQAAAVAGTSTGLEPQPPASSLPASPSSGPADAQPILPVGPAGAFLSAMNLERERAGLPRLEVDLALASIAHTRSADMAAQGYFAHVSPSGTSWLTLANQAGLQVSAGGENLARVSGSDVTAANTAVALLMQSPTHRANILSARFTSTGVAAVTAADGMTIFTTIFAAR